MLVHKDAVQSGGSRRSHLRDADEPVDGGSGVLPRLAYLDVHADTVGAAGPCADVRGPARAGKSKRPHRGWAAQRDRRRRGVATAAASAGGAGEPAEGESIATEAASAGVVGHVANSHYSIMGYLLDTTELQQQTVPLIVDRLRREEVDVVLLVPV